MIFHLLFGMQKGWKGLWKNDAKVFKQEKIIFEELIEIWNIKGLVTLYIE